MNKSVPDRLPGASEARRGEVASPHTRTRVFVDQVRNWTLTRLRDAVAFTKPRSKR